MVEKDEKLTAWLRKMSSLLRVNVCQQTLISFFFFTGNIHAVIVTFGLYIGGKSECVMMVS